MKNSIEKLVKYFILNEMKNNSKSLDIINNLINVYNINEKTIYKVIEKMTENNEYKVID